MRKHFRVCDRAYTQYATLCALGIKRGDDAFITIEIVDEDVGVENHTIDPDAWCCACRALPIPCAYDVGTQAGFRRGDLSTCQQHASIPWEQCRVEQWEYVAVLLSCSCFEYTTTVRMRNAYGYA